MHTCLRSTNKVPWLHNLIRQTDVIVRASSHRKRLLQSFAERTAELLCLLVAIRQRNGCQSDGQWAPRLVGRTNVRQAFMSTMCNFIHARSKPFF
ncbi:hypothetical protein T02_13491 [Trichinella nativa]|uniref:Uncharacterized protein n=1 Tax=Trichinella nativa TaxID=6335 RepID=A0A0V1LEZ7_9BILA|nr:hypothetical protein T06_8160 [Trichinella sp. T6]KRZ58003.1 hypothetical protein T02_13491 [Trichinella nativa]